MCVIRVTGYSSPMPVTLITHICSAGGRLQHKKNSLRVGEMPAGSLYSKRIKSLKKERLEFHGQCICNKNDVIRVIGLI